MIRLIIFLIIIAVFNTVFFLLNTDGDLSQSQWVTYGFINCGIVFPFIVSIIPVNKPEIKASMISSAVVYGVLELVAGIILLAYKVEYLVWPFISQIIMLAIALIICLSIYTIDKRKNL